MSILLIHNGRQGRSSRARTFTVTHTRTFTFEPAHEIMVFFVLRELILQTRMRSHPVGLNVWCLVEPFVDFHTSCVRTAKALARLRECAGSPEPSLVAHVISTKISWAGSNAKWEILPSARTKATENVGQNYFMKEWKILTSFVVSGHDFNSQYIKFCTCGWFLPF